MKKYTLTGFNPVTAKTAPSICKILKEYGYGDFPIEVYHTGKEAAFGPIVKADHLEQTVGLDYFTYNVGPCQ